MCNKTTGQSVLNKTTWGHTGNRKQTLFSFVSFKVLNKSPQFITTFVRDQTKQMCIFTVVFQFTEKKDLNNAAIKYHQTCDIRNTTPQISQI